ncbi:MAG: HAMP domain-containing protein [SAR324 cluster bacterium]|nr:HAMP domain-containing protein [SAR324 cluster bacterium]
MLNHLVTRSIVRKFIVNIVVLLLLGSSIFIIFYWRNASTIAVEKLQIKTQNLAKIMSTALVTPIWSVDEKVIDGIINAISEDTDVVSIRVEDSTDQILGSYQNDAYMGIPYHEIVSLDGMYYYKISVCREGACAPDRKPGIQQIEKQIGLVQIITSIKQAKQEIFSNIAVMIKVVISLTAGISIVLWYLARRLIQKPINALIRSANELSAGNLDYDMSTKRKDELGILAHYFVKMRDAIREKIRLIEEYSQGLEEKVVERTLHIEHAQKKIEELYHQSQQDREELEHINHVVQMVSQTLDLDQVFYTVKDALQPFFKFELAGIFLLDEEQENLKCVRFYGMPDELFPEICAVPLPFRDYVSYICETALKFEPHYFSPLTEDFINLFFPADFKFYKIYPVKAYLLYPLMIPGKTIGTLVFSDSRIAFDLSEATILKIQRYVNQIAAAINNADLVAKTRESLEITQSKEKEITHINTVMQTVNSTLNLDTVVVSVIEALQTMFRFDQMGIILKNDETRELSFYKPYGNYPPETVDALCQLRFPMDHDDSFYVKTVLYNSPNYIPNITPELVQWFVPDDLKAYQINPVRGALMYPLEVQNEVIGLIGFSSVDEPFDLTEELILKIQRYVTQLGAAIHNAQLYEQLKTTRFQLEESEKVAAMTRTFEKFVPRQFLQRITNDGNLDHIELGKAEADVITILFSDIRSFTTLSERMSPQELLNFLNAYLKRMNAPIHQYGGYVDKFIGDAIMALFDLPGDHDSLEAENAIHAAIAMQHELRVYNEHRSRSGYSPVCAGIGIHSGPVIIGTVGSLDRMDSTVLGETVNLASRIESLTKHYGVDILASSNTLRLLKNHGQFQYRELDKIRPKGASRAIDLFEIYDHYPPEIRNLKYESGKYILKGLVFRNLQEWDEAIQAFEQAHAIFPEDKAPIFHIWQCHELQQQNPDDDWDGSIVLNNK